VMLGGIILMLVAYFPAFHALERFGNPALAAAQEAAPVSVASDPRDCSLQFDPVGKATLASACDIAKSILSRQGVSYGTEPASGQGLALIGIGEQIVPVRGGEGMPADVLAKHRADTQGQLVSALRAAGYPERADPGQTNPVALFLVLLVLCIGTTALYGPQAAALVEMFPARVRYTALSLPYHIGTGWVGGFLPAAAFAIVTTTGDIYAGIWYPFAFTAIAAVVMLLFLKETRGRPLDESVAAPEGPVGPG